MPYMSLCVVMIDPGNLRDQIFPRTGFAPSGEEDVPAPSPSERVRTLFNRTHAPKTTLPLATRARSRSDDVKKLKLDSRMQTSKTHIRVRDRRVSRADKHLLVWRVCECYNAEQAAECTHSAHILLRSEARLVEIRSRRRRRLDGLELWQEALPRG